MSGPPPRRWPRVAGLSPALFALLLAACAGTPSRPSAPVALDAPFSESGDGPAPDRWWRTLDDGDLDALVADALESNLDLAAAWHRLQAAQAVADRESASLLPGLDLTAEAGSETGNAGEARVREGGYAQGGLSAAYEVDLWGRIRDGVAAERLRARAARSDYHAAALSLAAEVARTWYRLAEARARRELLGEQVTTNDKALRLLKTRFAHGRARSADLRRQRRLLESVRQQRHAVEARIRTLENQLAVLLGRPPQEGVDRHRASLPSLPPLPDAGLPAELVERRPDVRSAFLRVRAADREVAAAISNQYPRLSLSASALTSSQGAAQLYDDWALAFAANLTAPLLDAGRREAEVARSRAVEAQRLQEYGQAVLTAFRDVEDALVREREQRDELASLRRQARLSARSHRELRRRYLGGDADFLDVLTARADTQALRREVLAARLDLVEHRIALYRALAGGFDPGRPAEPQSE